MKVFFNSPPHPSDEFRVRWEYDTVEAYRLKRSGKLAGWYGALALGRKTVVSYSESQALLATSEDRTVSVPLPPRSTLKTVTRVSDDGREDDCEHSLSDDGRVVFAVTDCGRGPLYYRLAYDLPE